MTSYEISLFEIFMAFQNFRQIDFIVSDFKFSCIFQNHAFSSLGRTQRACVISWFSVGGWEWYFSMLVAIPRVATPMFRGRKWLHEASISKDVGLRLNWNDKLWNLTFWNLRGISKVSSNRFYCVWLQLSLHFSKPCIFLIESYTTRVCYIMFFCWLLRVII